jgi:phosphoribosylanthranilate isomerase
MTRIKITGVVEPEDADMAAAAGVDMIACVMNASSPRYVTTERVWDIRRALRGRATLVGVFADTPEPLVQRLMDHCQFDCAQLFGAEGRSAVDGVRPHGFKAVSVSSEPQAEQALRAFGARRWLPDDLPAILLNLVDGMPPRAVAAVVRRASTIVAAAGLTPAAMGELVSTVRPWGIDVWESVESAPGRVDRARLEALVTAVREAEASETAPR